MILTDTVFGFLLCLGMSMARMLTALLLVPGMQFTTITGMLRNAIVMALALPVAIAAFEAGRFASVDLSMAIVLILKEAFVGLVLGVFIALPFWLFQIVGTLIDQQRGANVMQQLNPALNQDASALGGLMSLLVFMIVVDLGGLTLLLAPIYESYLVLPIESTDLAAAGLDPLKLAALFAKMLSAGVLYIAPFTIAMLLVDLAFAFISLSAPQLEVTFMSPMAKTLLAMVLLVLTAPLLWDLGAAALRELRLEVLFVEPPRGAPR
jgi:type III secretion protein T